MNPSKSSSERAHVDHNYKLATLLKCFYRCFSRNMVKIYRTAILTNYFRCIKSKSQWSTHPVLFFNPLMLVVTDKIQTQTNLEVLVEGLLKYLWPFLTTRVFKGLKGVLEKHSLKNICDRAHISKFANLQVGKYAGYCFSSNKHQTSNKCRPVLSPAPNSFKT